MKHIFISRVLTFLLVFSLACVLGQAQRNQTPLTNSSIVKLAKAGFKEKTIISIIASRLSNFDLSPERMIELKRSGVTEKVILAMLSRQEGMDVAADDTAWSDDPFFNEGISTPRNDSPRGQNPSDGSSVDIFGSSGGLRGETQTRGGGGSSSGDIMTTGSATVRIIRPPSEANAPTKLEKTPSLTNASIIELVEAGFSEGTVVRRIEQSPVEFDLSPASLEELKRKRVSEKILTAMKAAMGADSAAANSSTPNE
ncbi:MAG TPA: hypothetical protein VJ023_03600 [Pyrinomonadaceae bacterium]|nr:hypothetical protein [Pyrinomonadaceae bacterium]